jgi:hypothetical protein
MSDLGWATLTALLLAVAIFEARRALGDYPADDLIAPVNQDVTAHEPRVLPPDPDPARAAQRARDEQIVAALWPDTLNILALGWDAQPRKKEYDL